MQKEKLWLIALILVVAVFISFVGYLFVQLKTESKPSWLDLNVYMIYEQVFVWDSQNETEYMTWNVTEINVDFANIHLVSHSVNITDESVVITLVEADWIVNMFTREITNSSDLRYVGKKCPFWIQTNVEIGSTVDIFYGINKIGKSEIIEVLGQSRDCWMLEYNWKTANMKRWYDKLSGICLKIQVALHREGHTITITETAVETNIHLK